MKKNYLFQLKAKFIFGCFLVFTTFIVHAQDFHTGTDFINKLSSQSRVAFIENDGQLNYLEGLQDKKILFEFDDEKGMHAYFTASGVIYKISKEEKVSEMEYEEAMREGGVSEEMDKDKKHENESRTLTKTKFVEMNWQGANSSMNVTPVDPTSFYFNYYMPNLGMNKIIGNVKGFTKLVYENVYPGIDVEYTIHPETGLKYSYILHPGCDPSAIKMNYNGATLKKDASGNVIISSDCGEITDHAPLTYKAADQNGKSIESEFKIINANTVSFTLANGLNVITETTVIDPWQVGVPFPINGYTPNDVAVDGSGNVLVYSYKPRPNPVSNPGERIDKYNSAGVFQWTFDLAANAHYVNDFQGDVAADPSGNVYVSIGLGQTATTYYNTIKINPTGTGLIWGTAGGSTSSNNMFETWTITFNCAFTQFYQSGGGLVLAGVPVYNVSVEEPVNSATGAEGAMLENDTLGEIMCTYYAPNSLVYHMAADSNAGATRTGAASAGNFNTLTCINPATGVRLFRVKTGYPFVDGDAKAPGSVGMNSIVSSCNYVYTTSGNKLDRWNPTTGAHYNQVIITGGSSVAGFVNSGILTDKCGNVYVGSNNAVYVYDPTLVLINTISGLPGRVFDMAWGDNTNTNLIICGGTSNATTFLASVAVTSCTLPNMVTITPTQPSCSVSTGSATANATFCGAPYSYLWSPGGQTTQTVTGLTPGTYTVQVSSSISCPYSYVQTQTVTITPSAGSLTATQSSTNITCNAACNGTATVSPSGGTPGYTYSWAPSGGSAATASSLCPGNYTCTISDAGGCVTTQSFAITQPLPVTATSSQVNVTCNGSCNGSASVVAGGGTGTYTYAWTPSGGSAATASGLCPTNYTCTISSPAGCSITQSFTITQPLPITASSSQVNVTCNGSCNGSASVVAGGGTGSYTYAWLPSGGSAATASGLCPSNYTCTISSPAGCSITQSFAITQPLAITSAPSQVDVTCNGSCNGSASVVAGGGTGSYTYAWLPSGGSAATASGLCATNYTCTISSPAGCSITQSFTITQPPVITAIPSQVDVTCNGSCNGSASVVAGGGSGSYTYAWTPSGGSAATASGLCPANYTCTISSPAGCSITQSFAITQPPVLTATQSQVNLTCNGTCNGSASVVAGGGTGSYTYNWTPSGGSGATASGLCANNYTCTISSPAGCTITQSFSITQPSALTASSTSTPTACGGNNGTATAVGSGGTSGYTYSWAPTGGNAAIATGLSAGSYTCTVTDANNCTTTTVVSVTNIGGPSSSIASSGNISCFGGSNGTATVNASGGTPNYTYSWSPTGGNAATASGLSAGPYTCTVTDASGCVTTSTVTITEPSQLTATASSTPSNCGAGNGTATVTPSGGISGYTYSWAPTGGSAATASSLSGGNYTCTVTDANGCSTTASTTITNSSGPTATLSSSTDITCFGGNNGTATANPTGGTLPYTYAWTPTGGNAATANGLSSGSYTCTITDSTGCNTTVSVIITEPAQLTSSASSTPATCSANNGTATATPTGGTGSYSYNWTPTGGTNATATGLASGNYTVTITDANSCTTTQTVAVTQTAGLATTVNQTNITCFGSTNGSATINTISGNSPYTFVWSSGGSSATETGLGVGTYTCTITDSTGCTGTQTVSITQPTQLTASATSGNVTCNGGTNGTGTVTGNGGTGAYTYSWSPSGGNNATATGLGQGTYTCTITDANGCITTQSITITQPTALSATSSGTNILCNGGTTGTTTVSASGGTAGYNYNWTPAGGTGSSASGLSAGTYTCTITDANGCITTQTVTVTQPTVLTVSMNSDSVCAGSLAQISSNGGGGVGPYTYLWSNGATSASQSVSVTSSTTYTVTVTDANGCTTTGTATAGISPAPTAAFTSNATNGFFNLASAGTDLCFTDQSTGSALWAWDLNGTSSFQQSPPCITVSSADTGQFCATLIVVNLNGCADTTEQCITIGESSFSIPNIFTPNGDGSNDVFLITNSGMKSLQCSIYDRWGELIYTWDGTSGGWDGKTKNGNEAVDGVYYYTLIIVDYAAKEYDEKGFVELIRGK